MTVPEPSSTPAEARQRAAAFVSAPGYRSSRRRPGGPWLVALAAAAVIIGLLVAMPRLVTEVDRSASLFDGLAGGLVALSAVGAAWAGMRTTFAFRMEAWVAAPLLVLGMLLGTGAAPSLAAAAAALAAGVVAVIVVGLVRFPIGVIGMGVLTCVLWGMADAVGGRGIEVVGVDAPHPPLWVLVPMSYSAYVGLLVNWLALLWAALCGASVAAFRLGGSVRGAVLVATPAAAIASSAVLPSWAGAAAGVCMLLAASWRLAAHS